VALAAEAGARVDERDGDAQPAQLVGVDAGGDVAFQDPSRTRSPSAAMVAFRSVVLPAPGEDIRLTVVTPARAKSARLRSATRSFSSRMLSSTATRSAPVSR
jgi:hypothetical protein